MCWRLRSVAVGTLAFTALASCQMLGGLADRRIGSGAAAGQAGIAGGEGWDGESGASGQTAGPGESSSGGERATGGSSRELESGREATEGNTTGGTETGGISTGGTTTDGATTGGSSTGGTRAAGGASGLDTGGTGAVGTTTGGSIETAGASAGDADTGGNAAGGVDTGGAATGGASTGGVTGASCNTNVTPCGGDVVGLWNVTSSCLKVTGTINPTLCGLACQTGTITEGSLQVTGTWGLKSDGTYEDKTSMKGQEKFTLPPDCKELSGTTITCDRLGIPVAAGFGYSSVTCVDDTASGGCACTGIVDTAAASLAGGIGIVSGSLSKTGTFTMAGNVITTSDNATYSYCVSGTMMTVSPRSAETGCGTTTGTVVFQRW